MCGCRTSERCWNACCCHSLAERLAWVRKRGVRPPQSAIAEARRVGLDVAWIGASAPQAGGCASDASCTSESTKTCCKTQPGTSDDCATPSESRDDEIAPSHVILMKALACQGQSPNWLAAVPTMVHVTLELSGDVPPPAWIHPPRSEAAMSNTDTPTVPPPEVV
jgi:hypothetical protein